MLFKQDHLDGIKAGAISLAFRKWNKAAVNKGTLLKTAVGLVEIVDIVVVDNVKDKDAQKAGFKNTAELMKSFERFPDGELYKIKVRYHSADPRIALREKPVLTEEEIVVLKNKLQRLDEYSKEGAWTKKILSAIKKYPRLRAIELAAHTGKEKEWLKLNIRKLKNLGLTISHDIGYEISPMGEVFIKKTWRL